jgi:diadenosine tetraphosphate (Ap4A) HIT family hydrolase
MRKLSCKWPFWLTLIGFSRPIFYVFWGVVYETFSPTEFAQKFFGAVFISIIVWVVYGIACLFARSRDEQKDCDICEILTTEKTCVGGGIVKLPGGWFCNHYGDTDAFLGWLALQTRRHIEHFEELHKKESKALGQNLKLIETALRSYWSESFPDDPIERIYAVCFSEYSKGHFHFHLIPRTKELKCLLKDNKGKIIPWNVNKINKEGRVPPKYVVKHFEEKKLVHDNENVENLMNWLKEKIES